MSGTEPRRPSRLAQVKAERDAADRLAERYRLLVHDLVVGEPERVGKRFTVAVKANEIEKDTPRAEAIVFRPLGSYALVLLRFGSYLQVEGEDWLYLTGDQWRGTTTLRVLQERARLALNRARQPEQAYAHSDQTGSGFAGLEGD